MWKYTVRRLLLIIPTLFLLGTILFFMLRVLPGDEALFITSGEESVASIEDIEALREAWGLNDPLYVQYGRWVWDIFQPVKHGDWLWLPKFDLGYSRYADRPVVDALASKIEVTATLAFLSVVVALAWSLPLGIISALWRGSWIDQTIRVITAAGIAMPNFWVAILMLLFLVKFFNWIPPVQHVSVFDEPLTALKRLIFPALVIGFRSASTISRMTRSTMLEVIGDDYIRTARAKGLGPYVVTMRHALANAIIPVLTMAGLLVAALMDGAVIIERIFTLPGLGQQIVDATSARDFVMVQGIVLVLALFMMLWILVVDLLYAWIDPRIRYE